MDSTKVSPTTLASPLNPAHYFAYASSSYLLLLSFPLLAFPRVLLLLSTPRGAAGQAVALPAGGGATAGTGGPDAAQNVGVSALGPELTPIERFASYAWGISMVSLAVMAIVQTGAIPLTSKPLADAAASGASSPYRFPTVLVLTLYFLTMALLGWTSAGTAPSGVEAQSPSELGIGAFGKLVAAPNAALAFWGLWVLMFGSDATRNRKKAGDAGAKDKATSSFPFKNTYAEGEKQK